MGKNVVAREVAKVLPSGVDYIQCFDQNLGGSWDAQGPDHESVVTLMRNLNEWRHGAGKPYLLYGRMVKPVPFSGDHDIPMITPRNQEIHFRSVFASRWTHGGKTAQFFVNYTPEAQEVTIIISGAGKSLTLFTAPADGKANPVTPKKENTLHLSLPPLSPFLLEE